MSRYSRPHLSTNVIMQKGVVKVESILKEKQMIQNVKQETVVATAKIGPAIGGATLYGFTLNELIGIFTLLYVILQIGLLIPKYVTLFKNTIQKLFKS